MRLLKYLIILMVSMIVMSSTSIADTSIQKSHIAFVFQVVQSQINFDNAMIKSASLITKGDGAFAGLQIEVKPSASKELTRITAAGVGKVANLVINDKIVASAKLHSSLQNQFLITDITKEDAQKFIDSLNE